MRQKFDEVDEILSTNLKIARINKGVSQAWLGETLGVSYQQIQRYESKMSKLSASSIYKLAIDLYPDKDIGDTILWLYGLSKNKDN